MGTRGFRRLDLAWIAVGALGLLAVVLCALDVTDQWRKAALIDASPVTVKGVVDHVMPQKGGVSYDTAYTVGGSSYSTGLALDEVDNVRLGTKVCLQAAATAPRTVRLCGERYPQGNGVQDREYLIFLGALTAGSAVFRVVHVALEIHRDRRPAERSRLAYSRANDPGRKD